MTQWPWFFWLMAAGVAVSPLSTKLGGALWFGLCLAGAWSAWRRRAMASAALARAARGWLLACAVALAAAALATALWRDPWDELHALVRVLLAAAAAVALAGSVGRDRTRPAWLTHALAVACFAAFGLACLRFESRNFPTNAIAWAVCIGFLVCLLLPRVFEPGLTRATRVFWGAGVLVGSLAVLLSGSRGAYGVVVWVLLYSLWAAWQFRRSRAALGALGLALLVLAAGVTGTVLASGTVGSRLWSAAEEITSGDANTSVGARMHLLRIGMAGFTESPWLGVGGQDRIRRIREAGEALHSPQLAQLGHMHNEYMEAAFEHGLLGLVSVLALIAGLLVAARRMARTDAAAGWQLAGIAFMHATAGLTNVNTAHNYYGAMLATCVLLAFMSARAPDATGRI